MKFTFFLVAWATLCLVLIVVETHKSRHWDIQG